ncbi:hypothetical protein D9M72_345600 [compost metagenome]
MDTGDEVGEEQRVGCRQPQRAVRIDAVQLRQLGDIHDAQNHADQGGDAEQHNAGLRLHVGGPHHQLFDPEKQLAVGNGRFGPHLVGTELEVV